MGRFKTAGSWLGAQQFDEDESDYARDIRETLEMRMQCSYCSYSDYLIPHDHWCQGRQKADPEGWEKHVEKTIRYYEESFIWNKETELKRKTVEQTILSEECPVQLMSSLIDLNSWLIDLNLVCEAFWKRVSMKEFLEIAEKGFVPCRPYGIFPEWLPEFYMYVENNDLTAEWATKLFFHRVSLTEYSIYFKTIRQVARKKQNIMLDFLLSETCGTYRELALMVARKEWEEYHCKVRQEWIEYEETGYLAQNDDEIEKIWLKVGEEAGVDQHGLDEMLILYNEKTG